MKSRNGDWVFIILRWLSIYIALYTLVAYGWWGGNWDHRFAPVTAPAFLLAGVFPDSMLGRWRVKWMAVLIITAGCLGEAASILNLYHLPDLLDRDFLILLTDFSLLILLALLARIVFCVECGSLIEITGFISDGDIRIDKR